MNNKTHQDLSIQFKVHELNASIKIIGLDSVISKKEGSAQGSMFIFINPKELKKRSTKIKIDVYSNGRLLETVKTSFLGPVQ